MALVCRRHNGLWDFQQISLHERGISFPPRMTGATRLSVHIVRRRLLMKTDYHLAREQQLGRTMGTIWAGMKIEKPSQRNKMDRQGGAYYSGSLWPNWFIAGRGLE